MSDAKKPPRTPSETAEYIVGLAAIAFVGLVIISYMIGKPAERPAEKACAAGDLQCNGERGVLVAGGSCPRYVEQHARHSVRWTDGTFDFKFTHFKWAATGDGAITFVGDRVEFQNGFGAYTPMTYECDLSRDRSTVLAVRVREGRLPP